MRHRRDHTAWPLGALDRAALQRQGPLHQTQSTCSRVPAGPSLCLLQPGRNSLASPSTQACPMPSWKENQQTWTVLANKGEHQESSELDIVSLRVWRLWPDVFCLLVFLQPSAGIRHSLPVGRRLPAFPSAGPYHPEKNHVN